MKEILNLFDFRKLSELLQGYYLSTGFAVSILDLEGNVLAHSDWQIICKKFHRTNPDSCKRCLESDTILANKMKSGEKYHFYKCLNGLVDVVAPISINDSHVANLYSGQFLFEKADRNYFIRQAKMFGFDEKKYLQALDQVPIVSKKKAENVMSFLSRLTLQISELAIQKIEHEKLLGITKENELKYRSYIENAPDGIFIVNEKGKYIEVNKAACRITGYTEKELFKLTITDLIQKEHHGKAEKHFQTVIKDGRADCELGYVTKSGEKKFWNINAVKLSDTRLLSFVKDITASINAEAETHKFKTITDQAAQGSAIADLEGNLLYINKAFSNVHGYEPDELIGKNLSIFHTKDQLVYVSQLNKELFKKGYYSHQEVWHLHRSGTEFPMLMNGSVIMGKHGKPDYLVANAIDITELKKSEKALASSEEFLDRVIEHSPVSLWISDNKGTLIKRNQANRVLSGISDDDAIGKYNILNDNLIKEQGYMHLVENVYNTGEITRFTINYDLARLRQINGMDGAHKVLDVVVSPIKDEQGKVTNAIIQHNDITYRKQVEEDLKDSKEKLLQAQYIAGIGDFTWNIQTDEVSWSNGMYKLFKYDKDDEIDFVKINEQIYHPDDLKRVTKWIEDSIASGNEIVEPNEYRILCKNGETKHIHTNGKIEYKNGKAFIFFGTCLDVTERRKIEDELQISELKYRNQAEFIDNLIESSALSTWISDAEGTAVRANPACLDFFGATEEEIVGKYNLFKDEVLIKQGLIPKLNKAYEKGEIVDIVIDYNFDDVKHITVKNATHKTIKSIFTPIFDKNNKLINVICQTIDLTETKKVEEALKESEEKFRSIFENKGTATGLYGEDGIIRDCNQKFVEMNGFRKSEIIHKMKWSDFVVKEDLKKMQQYHSQRINQGDPPPTQYECGINSKNGEIIHVIVNISMMGAVRIVSLIDIRERKKAENELAKHREHLENLVEERTTELKQKNVELERFNNLFVGREFRIKELRDKIKALEGQK